MKQFSTGVANSVTVRAEYPNEKGMLVKILGVISKSGGDMAAIDVVSIGKNSMTRDLSINTSGNEHSQLIIDSISKMKNIRIVNVSDQTFLLHLGGKIEMKSRSPIITRDDMSKAYTPGVGRISQRIHDDPESVWALTSKSRTVSIITDGTAVLGLGDIGPQAALPVMEGKAMLLKEFGGVDAWPLCLDTKDPDKIIEIVKAISPGFGGIILEDISAPRCFYIEKKLKEVLNIPVFHDDQHGTAIVVLAALINSLKIVQKEPKDLKVVILGVGAAGTACAQLLIEYGITEIIGFDRKGSLSKKRDYKNNVSKKWFSENTNPNDFSGSIKDALKKADLFIGVSGPELIKSSDLLNMNDDSIVFALSNPNPEIRPEEIPENVRIMATGRSDYPNQVNNSLVFPGLFKGVLDVRATDINNQMKLAAAEAIAESIPEDHLSEDFIVPSIFDQSVVRKVSKNVSKIAYETGVARRRKRSGREMFSTFKRTN
jgi:malate dehydrogenase (oxaloacetate-decarboxylating)